MRKHPGLEAGGHVLSGFGNNRRYCHELTVDHIESLSCGLPLELEASFTADGPPDRQINHYFLFRR